MDRKEFIKSCGFACIAATPFAAILQGCSSTRISGGKINGDDLVVDLSDFITKGGNSQHFKKYLVVQHEILKYPICIFRLNEFEYTALWMQCTHQGAELQVFGDKLQCPAHGSEFDDHGELKSGPADVRLRTFPVVIEKDQLKISLKAI